ncbi:MAG: NADH dehydrogenase ubiquinone Fe-S protein 4 [Robiginitomaculum sp.]
MFAKIFQPARNAMQSGLGNSQTWALEFSKTSRAKTDPLTGNRSQTDTLSQLDLKFETMEDAIAYAKARGIAYHVTQKPPRKRFPRSYGENFDYDRKLPWTH